MFSHRPGTPIDTARDDKTFDLDPLNQKTWTVELDGVEHELRLDWTYWRG